MLIRFLSIAFILIFSFSAQAQFVTYFNKIQELAAKERMDTVLYKKLDSLKKTRRPNDSYIRILFNRDVDFGYKHKRVQITLNRVDYQINLLIRNDTIYFSSVTFNNIFGEPNAYQIAFNKTHSIPHIDSVRALEYLGLRNRLYSSTKTLTDLKNELDLNEWYTLTKSDSYVDSKEKKQIDTLVVRRDFKELETLLKSINCETQTYGVLGFDLLKKKKVKIPAKDQKIIDHIKKRNSDLESTSGDIGPINWKAFK